MYFGNFTKELHDCGLICFVHEAVGKTLVILMELHIICLELRFLNYYLGLFVGIGKNHEYRPLRLKLRLKHIVSAVRPAQVIIDNNKRTC